MARMARDAAITPDLLRSRGLRSTPQRRAIMAAFQGGESEHLSADEVHARAARELPDLGRGTVYATLAEFTELGLLAAFGAPEPVRYETNTAPHAHFRCRLCQRLFDLDGMSHNLNTLVQKGFTVERVETRAEGICADCAAYETGLIEGVHTILATPPIGDPAAIRGAAAAEVHGPLGPLLLAATPAGLLRVAFEEHADAELLRTLAASRRGSHAARGHLEAAERELHGYLSGETTQVSCPIDTAALVGHRPDVLLATRRIPYAHTRSYSDLELALPPRDVGRLFGANPVALATPCHRVTRGIETPEAYVGGRDRRRWLLEHERAHPTPGPTPTAASRNAGGR